MIDIEKLKALAEAAIEQDQHYISKSITATNFSNAANPAAVLELIAGLETIKNSKAEVTQDMVDEFRQGQSQGESLNTSLLRVLRLCPGRGAAEYWKAENLAANTRLHEVSVACATAEQERDVLRSQIQTLQADPGSWQSGYEEGRRMGTQTALSERDTFKTAYNEWIYKSAWARADTAVTELGKHLADVIKGRFDQITAENEALRKDAERYRWLTQPNQRAVEFDACFDEFGVPIDAAIDSVMAQEQQP